MGEGVEASGPSSGTPPQELSKSQVFIGFSLQPPSPPQMLGVRLRVPTPNQKFGLLVTTPSLNVSCINQGAPA